MAIIDIERNDGIATVWLNRPDKKNAMSFEMMRALVAAAAEIKRDKTIRVVVLAGRGDTFCAGIDLADLKAPSNRRFALWELIKPGRSLFQAAALVWQDLPVPVLCAVSGHCLGAGVQLALGADIRFARADSQWSIMEARWGIIPDMGLTQSARGLVRQDVLKQLSYSADLFDGAQAHAYGFVTHVSENPLQAAYALAEGLSQRSPDALMAGKRVLDAMQQRPSRALRLEKIWQLKLLTGKNQARAVKKDRDVTVSYLPRQFD